jgi:DNA-binding NarL/FixJ family response regulator
MRILVVDDHFEIREKVKALLNLHNDIEIVGQAEDGQSAIELCRTLKPDVVLLDITMPMMNGIEAMGIMIAEKSCGRVIILSSHTNKRFIDAAINSGAMGYVLKSCIFEDLYNAIKAAAADNLFISPQTGISISEYKKRKPNSTEPG